MTNVSKVSKNHVKQVKTMDWCGTTDGWAMTMTCCTVLS